MQIVFQKCGKYSVLPQVKAKAEVEGQIPKHKVLSAFAG